MVKIVIIVKPDCPACKIVRRVISDAVNKMELDSTVVVRNTTEFIKDSYRVDIYPTTIFYRQTNNIERSTFGQYREIARLEGSFPIDYLNKVIDKLKLECNE